MRWFKHFSDNHRGRTVQTLLDVMGHDGAWIYYVIMEMCTEKLEKPKDRGFTEDDFQFTFHRRTIENCVRSRWVRIEKCLTCVALAGLLQWRRDGEIVEIKMPILLDLLDRDLKGTRSRRAQDAQKARLDIDIDSDTDIESELEEERVSKRKPPSAVALPPLARVWNENCGGLAKVQSCNGSRKRHAEARWREQASTEHWVQIVEKIKTSAFCGGKNDRGWRADFDWLIKPDTAHRVLEGRYDDRNSAKGQSEEYWKQVFGSEATQ